MAKAKYVGDLCVRTGTYKDQNGNEKGRWEKFAAMFENEQGQLSGLMTMVPLVGFGENGGVWFSFFPKRENDNQQQSAPPQQQQPQQPPQQNNQQPPQQRTWGRK